MIDQYYKPVDQWGRKLIFQFRVLRKRCRPGPPRKFTDRESRNQNPPNRGAARNDTEQDPNGVDAFVLETFVQ